jgi:hypothetical protein
MIIVYSANFGGYDKLLEPIYKDKNCRYILFTDQNIKSQMWEVIKLPSPNDLDSQRLARYYKLNPHLVLPAHNYSVWVDSCIKIKKFDVKSMINTNYADVCCYKHPRRDCLYKEAEVCKSLKLDYANIIDNQIQRYQQQNFPCKFGLFDTAIMIRKNEPHVNRFNDLWWQEVKNGSRRDQLSQMYVSWVTGVRVSNFKIGVSKTDSPYFHKKKHIKQRTAYE